MSLDTTHSQMLGLVYGSSRVTSTEMDVSNKPVEKNMSMPINTN